MEAIVMGIVLKSAKRIGIARDSEVALKAVETGVLAIRDGRSVEVAVELGEAVLVRYMQPAA
jgi:hypothetical protein